MKKPPCRSVVVVDIYDTMIAKGCEYMIDNDFSTIQLRFRERWMLRYMKWLRKQVPATSLSNSTDSLRMAGFIREVPTDKKDAFNAPIGSGKYEITDRYIRYCIYRRDKFMQSSVWPAIVSGVVSLIVSFLIAKYVTQRTIEQEIARQLAEALTKMQ